MKKRCGFIITVIFLTFALAYASASQELECHVQGTTNAYIDSASVFLLPENLEIIDEGAFEGTAIEKIKLPETVTTIGEYAFANIRSLRTVQIPTATTYIAKTAFEGSFNTTITAALHSYARKWAHENGIPFNPITSFYAFNNTVQVNGGLTNSRAERLDIDSEQPGEKNPKPTGRMTGELNAEKKGTITAFHIQGRSPPMA